MKLEFLTNNLEEEKEKLIKKENQYKEKFNKELEDIINRSKSELENLLSQQLKRFTVIENLNEDDRLIEKN